MILILSSPADEHTKAVMRELDCLQACYHLLDLSDFPQKQQLAMAYGSPCSQQFELTLPDNSLIDLMTCGAIWLRRPQPYVLHPELTDGSYREFVYTECHEALSGLWYALDQAFWINQLNRDDIAHRKAYQLQIAQRVGLRVPTTLITNSSVRAKAFIENHASQKTIFKAFSATEHHWRETRIITDEELNKLDSVKYAPVIFQEYIEAEFDIRLTVVGNKLFAAAIHSQQSAYKIDMRMDIGNTRIEPVNLPHELNKQILSLMRTLKLQYGAIDLRRTPQGEYVFLEINPAGQWLFIEQAAHQPISATLAQLLHEKDHFKKTHVPVSIVSS